MTTVTVPFQNADTANRSGCGDVRVGTWLSSGATDAEVTMVITDTHTQLDHCHQRVSIVPHGEIDAGTVDDLASSLQAALLSGAQEIDLDLADVSFMDTAAIEVLQATTESLEATGGHLCLRNPTSSVRRLLSLTAFAPGRPPHG